MKRIYRDESKAKIAGICAGLGEQFNIDPTLLRLGMVFLAVITGFVPVPITYLVGWAIIPEKKEIGEGAE